MSYIGQIPLPQATEERIERTATAGQTSFTGLTYVNGHISVYLNGVKLDNADFTATDGTTVTLATGAAAGDTVSFVSTTQTSALVALPLKDSAGNNVLSESGSTVTLTSDEANVGSNALVVDSSGNVGIGTSSPANSLTVEYTEENGLLLKNTNNASGQFARFTRINSGDTTNGDWRFVHTSKRLDIQTNSSGGSFSSPSFSTILQLEHDGDVRLDDSSLVTSDERFKENIKNASPKLDDLMRLKVRNFNFTSDSNVGGTNYSKKRIGFIAQEFSEVFPNLVKPFWHQISENDEDAIERLSIRQDTLIPIIVKAIQEQQALIESQQSQILSLTARIEALETT